MAPVNKETDLKKGEDGTDVNKKAPLIKRIRDYKLYPRAHEANISVRDPSIRTSRVALLRAAAKNFVILQTLFFALFCYIFGGLYRQNSLTKNLNVVFVDYDGGVIGEAVRSAYGQLQGGSFPTLQEKLPAEYPDPSALREEVCRIRSWGALYIRPGSSDAVQKALAGGPEYDHEDIMAYVWNEARYSAIADSGVSANMQLLSNTARSAFAAQTNWTSIIRSPSENTYATFASPWTLVSDNIQPTTQGTRLVYNTLVVILLMIQEFFYLGTLNQLYDIFKIYRSLNPHRIIVFRNLISLSYCFIGSLSVTGAIWIFKTGWHVNGNQFVLTWMVLWLFAHLNFLTLDVFTVWLPPPFVPMALITWLMFNVTSILVPFELMSDFYLWSYVMPAHEVYNTLVDIWSSGCNPVLRYSLPILFAIEISSFILSALGIHRRCHYAIVAAEAEQRAANDRLEAALAFDRKKRREEKEKLVHAATTLTSGQRGVNGDIVEDIGRTSGEIKAAAAEDAEDREELSSLFSDDRKRLAAIPNYGFGPSFGFGLTSGNIGKEEDGGELQRRRTFAGLGSRRRASIV
ncbi:uncharacterized protein PV09_01920 [Verruconis gallopava]|uniref:DUF3533 domain-containing protein n=1 Tax=Verruconis gallopava TaxID=253628 RepID=A0A0D1XWC5_9PEZI|nr:uncharacterized protein PV09_01920 [Verruconis gallopava]KIW07026.1 hypothetical protein PV09_01920 [Verruconis gallopava]